MGHNLQFTDIAIAFTRSIHDSRVLRYTALYQGINNNEILLKVNRHEIGPMLLGDGVDSLLKWLSKLHIFSQSFSAQETNFNKYLSSARVTVELAFGILKMRQRSSLAILDFKKVGVANTILT